MKITTWISLAVLLAGIIVIFAVTQSSGRATTPSSGSTRTGTNIGNLAPDFQVQTIEGEALALNDVIQTGPVVITTTASWCPTCVIEAKNFVPVYEQYGGQATFLSVSIDPTDDQSKLETFKTNFDTPWFYTEPNLPGVREMIIKYSLTRFEITYIIDQSGVVRFKDTSITAAGELRAALQKILSAT